MAKNLDISLLLDFYGDMLTEKQKNLIELYYDEDLSLGEISEIEHITRQGVRDSIKRGEVFLYQMEEKLGMFRKYKEQQDIFREILKLSTDIVVISNTYQSKKLQDYSKRIMHIAEENIDKDRS